MKKICIFILFLSVFIFSGLSYAEETTQGTRCGYNWDQNSSASMGNQINDLIFRSDALFDKGLAAYNIGDYLNAATYFQQAYTICPEQATKTNLVLSYFKLGNGYFAKEDYIKAIEYFKKSSDLQAAYDTFFNIGQSYNKLNDYTNALIYYKKAYDYTSDSEDIEQVKERIAYIQQKINATTKTTTTTTTTNTNTTVKNELQNSISRMYDNGLTIFTTPTSFMSSNGLRRDEATKFFVQYAKGIMGKTPDTSITSCNFTDLSKAWPDLKDLIKESCQLGLFQGSNGKFMPTQQLTNAQAITVFIRLIDGKKDETGSHFANEYYTFAHNLGLLDDLNLDNKSLFDSFTTRGEVATMLFRGKDK